MPKNEIDSGQLRHLWGLPTLKPRKKTVSAALSIGIKPIGGGYPKEKDCFHIVQSELERREERQTRRGKMVNVAVDYRPHDPRFKTYNGAPKDIRRTFYGMLCYHAEQEVWHPGYYAQKAPKGRGTNPTTKRPWCTGNGVRADRWNGERYDDIECPGEECPFRKLPKPDQPACRPRARFWFMPRWPESMGKEFAKLPRPIMRLASQGEEARETFKGMLLEIHDLAADVGFEIKSWYGLPFMIKLYEARNAEKGTAWPALKFSIDGDWMEWIRWQSGQFRALEGAPVLMLGSASAAELDSEAVGEENLAIVPSVAKPAVVAVPDVVEAQNAKHKRITEDPRSIPEMIEEEYPMVTKGEAKAILMEAGLMTKGGRGFPKKVDRAKICAALDAAVDLAGGD